RRRVDHAGVDEDDALGMFDRPHVDGEPRERRREMSRDDALADVGIELLLRCRHRAPFGSRTPRWSRFGTETMISAGTHRLRGCEEARDRLSVHWTERRLIGSVRGDAVGTTQIERWAASYLPLPKGGSGAGPPPLA